MRQTTYVRMIFIGTRHVQYTRKLPAWLYLQNSIYRRVPQFVGPPIHGYSNSRFIFCDPNPSIRGKKKKKKSPICDFLSQFQRFLAGQLPKFKFKILILLSRSNHLENTFHHIHDSTFHNIANQLPTIRKLDKNLPEICSHEK